MEFFLVSQRKKAHTSSSCAVSVKFRWYFCKISLDLWLGANTKTKVLPVMAPKWSWRLPTRKYQNLPSSLVAHLVLVTTACVAVHIVQASYVCGQTRVTQCRAVR